MAYSRIYLVSSAGYPNYGDELITASWLQYLATNAPEAEVVLDSPSPGNCELLFGGLHPRLRCVDTVFRLLWGASSDDPADTVGHVVEGIRNPGFQPRQALGVELMRASEVYHVLGGGYVNATWPRHLAVLAAGGVLTSEFGARSAATGLGLLPAADSKLSLDEVTDGFAVIDVRDAGSADLFSRGHVTVTGDDCLLDPGPARYDERETRSVMLDFQADHLPEGGVDALVTSAVETLRGWHVPGSKVGYVESMPGVDRRVFDGVAEAMPDIRFYPFTEIWSAGLPARRGQRWLTTRLHAHVMAAAVGAWGVAYPVSDYYRAKHEAVVEQGSRWVLGTPGEPAPTHHGEPGFGTRLPGLVAAKHAVAAAVYRA